MKLSDIPALRDLAESRARRLYNALYVPGATAPWDFVPSPMREHLIGGQLTILCNLRDNPDSVDALIRLVAAKVGIECGLTVPGLVRHHYDGDFSGMLSEGLMLVNTEGEAVLFAEHAWPNPGRRFLHQIQVSGLSRDPSVKDLCLIVLAVFA